MKGRPTCCCHCRCWNIDRELCWRTAPTGTWPTLKHSRGGGGGGGGVCWYLLGWTDIAAGVAWGRERKRKFEKWRHLQVWQIAFPLTKQSCACCCTNFLQYKVKNFLTKCGTTPDSVTADPAESVTVNRKSLFWGQERKRKFKIAQMRARTRTNCSGRATGDVSERYGSSGTVSDRHAIRQSPII